MGRSIRKRISGSLLVSLLMTAGMVLIATPAQAAISVRSASSFVNGSSDDFLTIPKPPVVVEGDVMVAQVTTRGGSSDVLTAPSGWTLERRTNSISNDIQQSIYWKTATAAEPTTYTWSFDDDQEASGGIVAYKGVDTASPIDVSSGGSNPGSESSTFTAPSVTTTTSNGVLLAFFGARDDTSGGVSQPTGMTERYDTGTNGENITSSDNDQALTSTGSTGDRVATYGSSENWVAQLVALRAAATTCTKTGTTLDIIQTGAGTITIGRSGVNFQISAAGYADPTCGGATVNNIDQVNVTGGSGATNITIDTTGGAFEPGANVEGTGISDIEFAIDGGAATDNLFVQGGSANDSFDATGTGVKLNTDDDMDITNTSIERVELKGGAGADLLKGSPNAENLFGEGDNDTVVGGDGADIVDGGSGDDLVSGGANADWALGGSGDDSVLGRLGSDEVEGGTGNDTLSPGGGTSDDSLDGGADRDTADYGRSPVSGGSTGVTVNLGTVGDGAVGGSGDQNTVAAGFDDLVGIESIRGSFYNDTLTGDGQSNFIFGWGGDDVISTLGGNDALSGGDGNDNLSGGDGSDQFYGGNGTDVCDGGNDVDDFGSDDGTCETELNAP